MGRSTASPIAFCSILGAARSSIVADDDTSSLPVIDQHSSSGVFKAHHEDVVLVSSLSLGTITRRDFSIVRVPADPHVTNLIGMDVLKDYCCHFRFADNRLLLSSDPPDATIDWQPLLMDARHHPYVDLRCGDQRAQAVWDTGASLTVVDQGFIDRHPALFAAAGQSSGIDATGTEVATPMFTMAASSLGPLRLPALRVAGVDLAGVNATIEIPMDMILGYNLLSRANWWFDFPRQRWAIAIGWRDHDRDPDQRH